MEKIDYKKDTYDIIVHINKFIDSVNDTMYSYRKASDDYKKNKENAVGNAVDAGIAAGALTTLAFSDENNEITDGGIFAGLVAGVIGTGIALQEENENLRKQEQLLDEYQNLLMDLEKKFKREVKDLYNYVSNAKNETYNLLLNLEEENNNIQKEIEFYKDNKIDSDNLSTLEQYIVDNNEKIKDLDSLNVSFCDFLKKDDRDIFEKIENLEENELILNYRNIIQLKHNIEQTLYDEYPEENVLIYKEEYKNKKNELEKKYLENEFFDYNDMASEWSYDSKELIGIYNKDIEERRRLERLRQKKISNHRFYLISPLYIVVTAIFDLIVLKFTKWPLDSKFFISCLVIMFALNLIGFIQLLIKKTKGELYDLKVEDIGWLIASLSFNVLMIIISTKFYILVFNFLWKCIVAIFGFCVVVGFLKGYSSEQNRSQNR